MGYRIGILVALALYALPAFACSCDGFNKTGCQVPTADVIVLAKVVSIDSGQPSRPPASTGLIPANRPAAGVRPLPEPWGKVKVSVSVSERFRGDAGHLLIVHTELGTDSCGYPFEVGHDYLIFASGFQDRVTVSFCSPTQPAQAAVSRMRQLRALRDGTSLPDLFGFVGTSLDTWNTNTADRAQPAPGLTVAIKSEAREYQTKTAEDGSYEFRGVPSGRYRVSVDAPPGRVALSGGAEHWATNVGLGIACPVDFYLSWNGKITGVVRNRDGQPASGVITAEYVAPEKLPVAPVTFVTQAGRFEMPRLRPGRYRLVFRDGGNSQAHAIYYPGTQLESAAALIDIAEGTHIDGLQFAIP